MDAERSKCILIVEDNRDHALLIQRAFKKSGMACTLQVAIDGDKAMDYLGGSGVYADRGLYPVPDLVLLDLKLPRRTGFEVLTWLRHQERIADIPVVILTTSNQSSEMRRAHECGANAYLVKPVESEKMTEVVRATGQFWLNHHRRSQS